MSEPPSVTLVIFPLSGPSPPVIEPPMVPFVIVPGVRRNGRRANFPLSLTGWRQ